MLEPVVAEVANLLVSQHVLLLGLLLCAVRISAVRPHHQRAICRAGENGCVVLATHIDSPHLHGHGASRIVRQDRTRRLTRSVTILNRR